MAEPEQPEITFGGVGRFDHGDYRPLITIAYGGASFSFWAALDDDHEIDPEDEAALDKWAAEASAAARALATADGRGEAG